MTHLCPNYFLPECWLLERVGALDCGLWGSLVPPGPFDLSQDRRSTPRGPRGEDAFSPSPILIGPVTLCQPIPRLEWGIPGPRVLEDRAPPLPLCPLSGASQWSAQAAPYWVGVGWAPTGSSGSLAACVSQLATHWSSLLLGKGHLILGPHEGVAAGERGGRTLDLVRETLR